MSRRLYRCLLGLHPAVFRRRFAAEMLWIFDEAAGEGAGALFLDGLVSVARQWLLRGRTWVVPAAIAGGLLQVLVVLSLTYLKLEARGAHEPPPAHGGIAVIEQPAPGRGANHYVEPAGDFHLGSRQETTGYAWPCGLLVLFAIVLVYSTPAVRRPFPSRSRRDYGASGLGTYSQNGQRSTRASGRASPWLREKAN